MTIVIIKVNALPTQNSIKICSPISSSPTTKTETKTMHKYERKQKNKDHNEIAQKSSEKREQKIVQWNGNKEGKKNTNAKELWRSKMKS